MVSGSLSCEIAAGTGRPGALRPFGRALCHEITVTIPLDGLPQPSLIVTTDGSVLPTRLVILQTASSSKSIGMTGFRIDW